MAGPKITQHPTGTKNPRARNNTQHLVNPQKISQRIRKGQGRKYAPYFKENEILPIPELTEALEPKILSFVVIDQKTRRLAGIKKEAFEEVLRSVGIPCRYFCRRSFATWNILLSSEDLVIKIALGNITTKHYKLQPEYRDQRHIRVTVCGVPIQLNGDVLAAYLSKYGEVDEVTLARSPAGTAHGDYVINMCLNREGFQAIPHIIKYQERNIMVIVEGRRSLCWSCKQLGHFSRSCPQTTKMSTATSATATTVTATATITTDPGKKPEHGDDPNKEEGWTQVVRKGKKPQSPPNKIPTEATITDTTVKPTTTRETTTENKQTPPPLDKNKKKKRKKKTPSTRTTARGNGNLNKFIDSGMAPT